MINLKTPDQIKRIRESCRLLALLFQEITPLVQEGITTLELDQWAYDFICKNKGKPAFKGYMNFPSTLCVSINEEVIHGIPSQRKIASGDLVGIDCGINLNGFFSDMAITFAVGSIKPPEQLLLEVTNKCLNYALETLSSGSRMKEIALAVHQIVKPHRFSVVHQYCGHGVGLSQHEEPQVSHALRGFGTNLRILPGMVLAVEPMINLGKPEVKILDDGWTVVTVDGTKSAHFEHTIAVLEQGIEILTSCD